MASIHVLSGNESGVYSIVVHIATPNGNNSAGISWKTAYVNSGMAKTVLTVGTGPGQITSVEKASIEAGDIVEGQFLWGDIPGASNPELIAALDARAIQHGNERLAQLAAQLKYYGFTRT